MSEKKLTSLTKKKDFDNVFLKGRSSFGQNLGIKATLNQLTNHRYGIIVSAKVSKKAVDRNRIKRIIREVLRSVNQTTTQHYDIVLITLPAIKTADSQKIKQEIEKNLEKLRILKK